MVEIEKSFNGLDLSIAKIQWSRFVFLSTLTNPCVLPGKASFVFLSMQKARNKGFELEQSFEESFEESCKEGRKLSESSLLYQ